MIAKYIAECETTSKSDIAKFFNLSMPTVLQKVRELIEDGIVIENGEYQSTGGRPAVALSIASDKKYAIGINILRNHLELVLVSLNGVLIKKQRKPFVFEDSSTYCNSLGLEVSDFIYEHMPDTDKIVGVGFSVPGILNKDFLVRSHTLELENFSLKRYSARIPYTVLYDNDANCAAYSEPLFRKETTIFLSLNNTLGGAFCVDGKLYTGKEQKSAEFGHMILVPDGLRCYCGKNGCVDSYCSALSLSKDNLESFFSELKNGNAEHKERWQNYLHYLSMFVGNLRVAYDCDIILGGYLGSYLQDYLIELGELTMKYSNFDYDASFLHCGKYSWEASAYGAAIKAITEYFTNL